MTRFALRYASNRHLEKVKQGRIYQTKHEGEYTLDFQEQPREGRKGLGVHTHVWLSHKDSNRISDIWDYIINECNYLPEKVHSFALVISHSKSEDNPEEYEPHTDFEFVVTRKLSQTMINDMYAWFNSIIEVVDTREAMRSLFGK